MTFEIDVNGKTRTVSVEAIDVAGAGSGKFRVRVDGVVHEVVSHATDLGISLRYEATRRAVDIALTPKSGSEVLLQLPHVTLDAAVDARRYRRAGSGPVAAAGELRVVAPMPGRVLRVLVKAGDTVLARQGLVVVEAMKMENEITAAKAGRVKEVAVAPGQSVESGRLLVVVE